MENRSREKQDVSQSALPSSNSKSWRIFKILFSIGLAIGACIAFYQVFKQTFPNSQISQFIVRKWISFNGGNDVASVPSGESVDVPAVRIAIAPIISPEKSMEMYQPFVSYVGEKLGRKSIGLYRPTYMETNDLVRYQRCDFAIVCTYPFIRGEREFGMRALAVPLVKGEETYQSFIVVPKDSQATTLQDLAGKRFATADIISTTGWLFPAMTLIGEGKDPNKFFGELVITGSHDMSLQAVIDGFVDGAGVHGIVYDLLVSEDPSIAQKVKVLAKSPPFGIPPIVIHPNLDPKLREAILSVLLKMHEDDQGKLILTKLQIDRFVIPEEALFAPLRLAVSKLEKWK
jgi:phosphonate transport system substrate-binding protein